MTPPKLRRLCTVFKQAAALGHHFMNASGMIVTPLSQRWGQARALFSSFLTTSFVRQYVGTNTPSFYIYDDVDLVLPGNMASKPSRQQKK